MATIMGYLDALYTKPFFRAISKWKLFLLSLAIEAVFVILVILLYSASEKMIMHYASTLEDNYLPQKDIASEKDYMYFFNNVESYNAEISTFMVAISIIIISFLLFAFLLYSLSRTAIWNRIHSIKGNYLRNFLVDLPYFLLFLFFFISYQFWVRPENSLFFLCATILPLLYFSFLTHLNYSEKAYADIFKRTFSSRLWLLLPNMLLFMAIFFGSMYIPYGTMIFLILGSFFRIYFYEAYSSVE